MRHRSTVSTHSTGTSWRFVLISDDGEVHQSAHRIIVWKRGSGYDISPYFLCRLSGLLSNATARG